MWSTYQGPRPLRIQTSLFQNPSPVSSFLAGSGGSWIPAYSTLGCCLACPCAGRWVHEGSRSHCFALVLPDFWLLLSSCPIFCDVCGSLVVREHWCRCAICPEHSDDTSPLHRGDLRFSASATAHSTEHIPGAVPEQLWPVSGGGADAAGNHSLAALKSIWHLQRFSKSFSFCCCCLLLFF